MYFFPSAGSNHSESANVAFPKPPCYDSRGFCLLFKENCPSGKVYERRFNDCPLKGKQKCCVKEWNFQKWLLLSATERFKNGISCIQLFNKRPLLLSLLSLVERSWHLFVRIDNIHVPLKALWAVSFYKVQWTHQNNSISVPFKNIVSSFPLRAKFCNRNFRNGICLLGLSLRVWG